MRSAGHAGPAEPVLRIRVSAGLAGGLLVAALTWHDSQLGAPHQRWALAGTLVMGLVIAITLGPFRRALPRPTTLPMALAASLVAIYACVPETDQVPIIAGALVAIAAVEVVTRAHLAWGWHYGLSLLVLAAGTYGATGRQSALVGTFFALWPLIALGLVESVGPLRTRIERASPARTEDVRSAVVVVATAASLVVARTGALQPTIEPALRAVAVWGPASALLILAIVLAPWPRRTA